MAKSRQSQTISSEDWAHTSYSAGPVPKHEHSLGLDTGIRVLGNSE